MKPEDVKLPIRTHIKLLFSFFKAEEDLQFGLFLAFIVLCGFGMAMCTPPFMTGSISNFVMKIFLTIMFGAAFIGSFIVLMKIYHEDIFPWFNNLKNKYNKITLPLKEQELKNVNKILLDDDDL